MGLQVSTADAPEPIETMLGQGLVGQVAPVGQAGGALIDHQQQRGAAAGRSGLQTGAPLPLQPTSLVRTFEAFTVAVVPPTMRTSPS